LLKIIAIIDSEIGAGGGFDQALNAIVQMKRIACNRFEFEVFTTKKTNVEFLTRLGIDSTSIKITILDLFLKSVSRSFFFQRLQGVLKLVGPLETKLLRHGCDIVYFVSPSNLPSVLQKLNYINTLWDLCHREHPIFPEVRNFSSFFLRENKYRYILGPALLTLTESQQLADNASFYYGIESVRFLAMPFAPSPLIESGYLSKTENIFNKYSLEEGYFFYPSQFWAHKNHIRILQALIILYKDNAWTPRVVFSGKDYGNLAHIVEFVKFNKLESQVKILGFVPHADMYGLYRNAMAVLMPTYFGPTNLPPLEAWSLGVPLIYSAQLADQAGNAALLVDADDPAELAAAMLLSRKLEVQERLISAGYRRLEVIAEQRTIAETKLCAVLHKFATRRECWK
jgi:glycosyltransferase involved in cell wall biosynthesis